MDALICIYNKVVSLIIEKEKTIQKQQKIINWFLDNYDGCVEGRFELCEKKIDCNECILKYIEAD